MWKLDIMENERQRCRIYTSVRLYVDPEVRPHSKNNLWSTKENKKRHEIQQVHVLCVDSYFFVVLCMLVGSTFSININEWAQAEKMPRGVNPACHRDWRWRCAVRSGQLWVEVDRLWHRQHKRRRWTSDVAASNSGWMMSVLYCVTMQQ